MVVVLELDADATVVRVADVDGEPGLRGGHDDVDAARGEAQGGGSADQLVGADDRRRRRGGRRRHPVVAVGPAVVLVVAPGTVVEVVEEEVVLVPSEVVVVVPAASSLISSEDRGSGCAPLPASWSLTVDTPSHATVVAAAPATNQSATKPIVRRIAPSSPLAAVARPKPVLSPGKGRSGFEDGRGQHDGRPAELRRTLPSTLGDVENPSSAPSLR